MGEAVSNKFLHGGHDAPPTGGFVVVDAQARVVDGPLPGFDIAQLVARQADLACVQTRIAEDAPAYRERLLHARRWFGGCVANWLAAGMPARSALPVSPQLAAVDPRMLARNGAAITAYLEQGPTVPAQPFYDQIVARYARARHGAGLSPVTARVALEPIHASLATRQMCGDNRQHRVVAAEPGPMRPVDQSEAAARLRAAAGLFRGLGRNWLYVPDTAWGRWTRYCRRSVMLDGVTAGSALSAARELALAADVQHGIDHEDSSRALRHALLHLAQWWLVSRP